MAREVSADKVDRFLNSWAHANRPSLDADQLRTVHRGV